MSLSEMIKSAEKAKKAEAEAVATASEGLTFTHSNHIDTLKRQCSVLTIQSEPRGQFAVLINHMRKITGNYVNVLLQISEKDPKDALGIVKYASTVEGMAIVAPKSSFRPKNDVKAREFRAKGNDCFKKGDFSGAFNNYSVAIINANYPEVAENDSLLAFSVGNRSACQFHMGNYEDAVNDIQFALSLDFPKESRHKIYERLGRSHLKLGNSTKAKSAFIICKQLLEKSDKKAASKMVELIEKCDSTADIHQNSRSSGNKEINVDNHHEKYNALNDKVEVACNNRVGRHTVAIDDLGVNETVLAEDALAHVLYPNRNGLNCQHCCKRLKSAVPCKRCSGVAFCSVGCRDEAEVSYHNRECEFQDVVLGMGCSQVARLAMRLVTTRPLSYFIENKEPILELLTTSPHAKENTADPYLRFLGLVGHEEERWPEDRLARAAMALVLLGILRASGYFGAQKFSGLSQDSYTNNELYIAALIYKHLEVLQFNAHEIYEVLRGSPVGLKPSKNVSIATAVYPTAALINHSCHGGLARFFQGTKLVLRTLLPLSAGSEVCDNYGPTFYLKSKSERRRELTARYWFECQCEACSGNWPLLKGLATYGMEGVDLQKANKYMEAGDAEAAIADLENIFSKMNSSEAETVSTPSELQIRAEDKLRTCHAQFGNVAFANLSSGKKK